MADYEAFIMLGDKARDQHQPQRAIVDYMIALDKKGPRDRYIRQMIGVCYQMLGQYEVSLERLAEARDGASAVERAKIERDMAESDRLLGRYSVALNRLKLSLLILPEDKYPEEHAATIGFMARLDMSQRKIVSAMARFRMADEILTVTNAHQLRLYNRLHYASALSEYRRPLKSRQVAADSLVLATKLGSKPHVARALVIIIAGFRGDRMLNKLRQRRRK